MKKRLERGELYKFAVLGFLLVVCLLFTYFCHFVLKTETIFTHLFYVPIILAGLWWSRNGILIATFLALVLLVSHLISPLEASARADVMRAFMFVVVGTVVAILNEKRQILEAKLRAYSRTLERKVEERTSDIRELQERQQAILCGIGDAVIVLDRDLNISWANDVAVGKYGALLGKRCYDASKWLKEPCTECIARKTIADGVTGTSEGEGILKDGGRINFMATCSPVRDSDKEIVSVVEVLHDITERKRIEEELKRKNTELERLVYTISHDLRAPLVNIEGFASMLRKALKRNETEKIERDLECIEKGATRMDHLLSDTLKLARIGRVINEPEDVSFRELIGEALDELAEKIESRNIEVSVADDLPTVHVDRLRIVEVLANLIENSIEFTAGEQHPVIEIGHRLDDGEVAFFVRDNGIGLDPSQHEKVFELFYVVDPGKMGTGVGLAIVKRIIEAHGGRIRIESEKGEGCTVCFTLPISSPGSGG